MFRIAIFFSASRAAMKKLELVGLNFVAELPKSRLNSFSDIYKNTPQATWWTKHALLSTNNCQFKRWIKTIVE